MVETTAERCTTCYYFQIPYPSRYCAHPEHHRQIFELHKPCKDFIHMFDKGHPNRLIKKTFDETRALIDADAYY